MGLTLLAQECKIGSTTYYLANVKANTLIQNVGYASEMENWSDMTIDERMQREIKGDRVAEEIVPYIVNDPDWFFGALIVDIYKGWENVKFQGIKDVVEVKFDAYDNTYHYHFTDEVVEDVTAGNGSGTTETGEWRMAYSEKHGFSESPLTTKRGDVAWNKVQNLIELFEIIFNLFAVIQKRHGWGILYIKGRFNETAKKIAGSIILNDTTLDGKGSAEFKAPPSPQGMIEFMQTILDQIQIGCGVTFILPKDVKSSGDISGLAIQMTRSLDIERTANAVIEWQNFVSKHVRLFKEGLAKQLVANGENPNAITEFAKMKVSASFKPWQPFDEASWNQMLCTLKNAGLISTKTGIEKNTVSTPDEEIRLDNESRQEGADIEE